MQKIAVELFYLLEEVQKHIANIEALLFSSIAGEHVQEVEGDAILKGLQTLATPFQMFVLVPKTIVSLKR